MAKKTVKADPNMPMKGGKKKMMPEPCESCKGGKKPAKKGKK